MGKIEVEMDGACLFRSIAVGMFYKEFGINIGGGCEMGEEITVKEVIHNVLSRWIRTMIVSAMFHEHTSVETPIYHDNTFRDILDRLYIFSQEYGLKRRLSDREIRSLKRQFLYPIRLFGKSQGNFSLCGEDKIPINIISMGGRSSDETHERYCKHMMHLKSWGGASEIYVASKLFHYAIYIKQGRKIVQKYIPSKIKQIIHVIYSPKKEHYDAWI